LVLGLGLVFVCLFRFSILHVFSFSLDYFVLVLFAYVVLCLVSSVLSQEIGWEERLRNDLFCVRWDIKPQVSISVIAVTFLMGSRKSRYSFPIPLRVGGWVGLGSWLHTKVVLPIRTWSPLPVLTGSYVEYFGWCAECINTCVDSLCVCASRVRSLQNQTVTSSTVTNRADITVCLVSTCLWCHMLTICFSALTLLVWRQKGHQACENWVVRYWRGYQSGARCKWFAYSPADAPATPSSLAPEKCRIVYLSGAGLPRMSWKKGD